MINGHYHLMLELQVLLEVQTKLTSLMYDGTEKRKNGFEVLYSTWGWQLNISKCLLLSSPIVAVSATKEYLAMKQLCMSSFSDCAARGKWSRDDSFQNTLAL